MFIFIILDSFVSKCDEKLGIVSPKKIRRYTILLTLCSLLYSIILSCLDIYTWNYEVKLNKKLNDKGPINYVPLYFMYIVIMMMEVQYAVATYNVCQRFCRLNKNIETILKRTGRISDHFRKDLGLGVYHFVIINCSKITLKKKRKERHQMQLNTEKCCIKQDF